MNTPWFFAASFGIIRNSDWNILFQKRLNTWYRDWFYQLPSWHIEKHESMQNSMIRELKEEININVKNLKVSHITQWVNEKWRDYFNIYFEIIDYTWEIKNLEKGKCSELYWANEKEIKENPYFSKDKEILEYINKWVCFSETTPNDDEF